MDKQELLKQNQRFCGTDGVSSNNQNEGFQPAFLDKDTGRIELARFPDGKVAPMHLISGLPMTWVLEFDVAGLPQKLKHSVVAGFSRKGEFYTREQAVLFCRWK